uniref:Uncharacterized protein n=1 Tax=Amphimedon queenslandica TaxID=400682 RepID=A0A1X7T2Z5_AMPQE
MMDCLFCGAIVSPGSRAYLKTKIEEVELFLDTLEKNYQFSKGDLEKLLREGIVCRGKCLSFLSKIVKARKEVVTGEKKILHVFGDVIVKNKIGHEISETPLTSSPESHTAQYHSTPVTPRSRRMDSSIGVFTICNGKRRATHLPPSLQGIGRSIKLKNRKSIVDRVIKDKRMKGMIARKVGKIIREEVKK